jgi:hypothetical protein
VIFLETFHSPDERPTRWPLRLNRGGDRAANRALHMTVVTRLRYHAHTRAYVARRTTEGLSKKDIIQCVKRYLAREIHAVPHRLLSGDRRPSLLTVDLPRLGVSCHLIVLGSWMVTFVTSASVGSAIRVRLIRVPLGIRPAVACCGDPRRCEL